MKEKEEKKWTVDFTKIRVEVTIDNWVERNMAVPLANFIHQQTEDIGIDDLAREIYHKGKCMFNQEQAEAFVKLIRVSTIEPYIKRPLIDIILNVKK